MEDTTLFDTDVLIDLGRGVSIAVDFFRKACKSSAPALSTITYMELLVGCRDRTEQRHTEKFVSDMAVVPVNTATCNRALALVTLYRLSHGLLIADALIAATAIVHGLPLVTKNRRDYRFIAGVTLIDYPAA
jgi:hypothetical protein